MPLASKVIQFPLASGVEEGVDPRTAKPGTLGLLKNCAWTKDGRLDKRAGTAAYTRAISGGGTLSSGRRLLVRGDELCFVDATAKLYSYLPGLAAWSFRSRVPEVGLTWDPPLGPLEGIMAADIGVTSDGKLIQAWVAGDPSYLVGAPVSQSGLLSIRVIDIATGAVIGGSFGFANANYCRVVTSGASWCVVYNEAVGHAIHLVRSDLVTDVILLAEGVEAGVGYPVFDAVGVGSTVVLGSWKAVLGGRVTSWTFAGVAVAGPVPFTAAFVAGLTAIGLHATAGENLYVVWAQETGAAGSKLRFAVHDPATLAQTLAPVNVDATANMIVSSVGVCRKDAASAMIAWSAVRLTAGTVYTDGVTRSAAITSAGVLSGSRLSYFQQMVSRPFVLDGRFYMYLCDQRVSSDVSSGSDGTNTLVRQYPGNSSSLVEIETLTTQVPHRYIGRVDVSIAGVWRQGHAPAPATISATDVLATLPVYTSAPAAAYGQQQGMRSVHATAAASLPENMWSNVEVGREAYLACGILGAYDGQHCFDFGFPRACPVGVPSFDGGNSVPGAVLGDSIEDGTYLYATVPFYQSAVGIVHRGPLSPIISFSLADGGANDNRLTLAIVPQTLGGKQQTDQTADAAGVVSHRVYRTTRAGSTLHDRQDDPVAPGDTNLPSVIPNVFIDVLGDGLVGHGGGLGARPLPYTVSELDDVAPPAALDLHLHKDRLWTIGGDRQTLWHSKDRTEDPQVAPGFNPAFTIPMGLNAVGLTSLDDKLIVLCEEAIFYVIGDGPAANGDASDYNVIRVQADVGCISARSIVSEPDGVMFLSQRGIYRLTRSLELVWIGKPVRDTLEAYPVITSAVVVHALNQIRFTCTNAAGDAGVVLAFDHDRGQWSVFEYSSATASRLPFVDATIYQGAYTMLHPSGFVYSEDPSTYLDAGTEWVSSDVETTEIFADGPLSYQRIRRAYILGARFTDCDLTVRIADDAATAYDQTRVWTSDQLANVGSANVGVHIKNQKPESLRIRISDAAPTAPGAIVGTGRGINLSAIGFEIAPKQGMDKRPALARK